MSIEDIFFLAVALSMDCFAVSVVSGVIMRKRCWRVILRMGVLFGLFQALMPFAGWLGTCRFSCYLESVDHWIAFGLLAFIGGKMIKESFGNTEEHHFNPAVINTQIILAVATSIDALAVGISFACVGYRHFVQLTFPLIVIGLVSLVSSIAGSLLGVRFGKTIVRKFRPELIGGVILIFIGFRILFSHIEY